MLAALTTAARRRRARETSRLLWRFAPIASAGMMVLAAVVRWKRAPAVIPFALLAVACAVWMAYAYVRRRGTRVSDADTAAIDHEAHLGGELRSAAWFAARGTADPWEGFHLGRAAEHLEAIDFGQLYPPVRARRARVATGVMIAAALVLVTTFPQRPHAGAAAVSPPSAPTARKVLPIEVEGLPPDLPQDLEDLLAAIETGTLAGRGTAETAALLDALSRLQTLKDPQALAALARAMAADRAQADDTAMMKDLADRTKRDAAMMPPSETRDALAELSKNLSDPEHDTDSAGLDLDDEAQPNSSVDMSGAPQSSRDASAIAAIGMVTLSKQEAADTNAPPGVGAGGSSSSPSNGGTMPDIAKALRQEIIEAHEDDVSSDVLSDARRKTERGTATTTFTRNAAGQFDGARTAGPRHVPETRRAGIQTYFTRRQ